MRGTADLPLHTGHAPPWLFGKMVKLGKAISEVIVNEYGTEELLRRLAHPYWFQSLSLVLGFDWHSSGTTTVTMGALKAALGPELGLVVAGGKGRASRKTPDEIVKLGDQLGLGTRRLKELVRASRLVAKVDNACVQDGYQLYHHTLAFDEKGNWTVIQQGMNSRWARRYHWFNADDFLNDPQLVAGQKVENKVMNLASSESEGARETVLNLARERPKLEMPELGARLEMPKRANWSALKEVYEIQPRNFEELLLVKGVGPSTLRALALISDVVFGKPPSYKDPIRYAFAVGGKDGVPFPVDRKAMDEATLTLREAVEMAKLGRKEEIQALRRLGYRIS